MGDVNWRDLKMLAENWLRCREAVSNRPPCVQFSQPLDEQYITLPYTLETLVQDIDGFVVKVEFLLDGSVIGEDSDGRDGWKHTLQNEGQSGQLELRAKATDNSGTVSMSPVVKANIGRPPRPRR